jgi:hypothetical protein
VGSMYHIFVFVEEPRGYYTSKKVLGFLFLDSGYLMLPKVRLTSLYREEGLLTHCFPTVQTRRVTCLDSYVRTFRKTETCKNPPPDRRMKASCIWKTPKKAVLYLKEGRGLPHGDDVGEVELQAVRVQLAVGQVHTGLKRKKAGLQILYILYILQYYMPYCPIQRSQAEPLPYQNQ